jgi:hypothetical protein
MLKKHFEPKVCALIIASLMAFSGMFALLGSDMNVDAANIPSTINSDWIVSSVVVYDGGSCVLSGNLTIQSGGNLTLRNLTLAFNNQIDGHHKIMVNSGGTLNIYNSTIKSNTDHRTLKLESQGTLFVIGSTLRDFGPSSGYNGIRTWAGKATFKGTTITNNSIGIEAMWVNPIIEDCVFSNINYNGFYLFEAWATIKNIKMTNVSHGTSFGAIAASANSRITLLNSEISDTAGNGFYLDDGRVEIYNTTFKNNTNDFNIYRSSVAHIFINATNTTFKKANFVGAGGSAMLSVYWYVNIWSEWESDHAAVPGGTFMITDKNNQYLLSGLLDNNGKQDMVRIKERDETTGSKTLFTPHTFNITGQRSVLNRTNETSVIVTKSLDLSIALDDVAPQLNISAPLEDRLTNKSKVPVEGVTEPGCQLWVNGVIASVGTDGTFVSEATLDNEGSNNITVKVRDKAGNQRQKMVNVTRDTIAPILTLLGPKNGDMFNVTSVEVFGTAEVGANLTINNVATTIANDGKFTKTLTLVEGENRIDVKCTDAVYNKANITIFVKIDRKGPFLQVAEPLDGYRTNETSVRVSGLTEPGMNVTVNSAVVPLYGSNFQTTVLLDEGDNTITVRSCDKVFNCNETSILVTWDTKPPTLEVTYPPIGEEILTNKNEITVKGYVEPGATVWIGKEEVPISGNWTYVLQLKEGKNKISVEAADDVGNRIELIRTVIKDSVAPALAIFYPEDVLKTSENQVTIKGSVETNSTIRINGATVSVSGNTFEQVVTLDKDGKFEFNITAMDLAGNSKTQIVTIIRDTLVNLTLTSPLNDARTKNATIVLKGTTDPGATLKVNNETVVPDANGKFEREITLNVGTNPITVKATDALGNEKTSSLTIIREKKSTPKGPILGGLLLPIIVCVIAAVGVTVGIIAMRKKKSTPPPPPIGPHPPVPQQQWAQGPSEQWAPPQGPPEGQQPQWPNPPAQ